MTEAPLFDLAEPLEQAPAPAWSERRALNALADYFSRAGDAGNGPRYAFVEHVRDNAGFDARRTIDAVAIDTWPSTGLTVTAIEVKVSRGDWLRELRDPTKAGAFLRPGRCDAFAVAGPVGVVKPDDLPTGWGWYELGDTVRCRRRAKNLRPIPDSKDLHRGFVVALVRAARRMDA